MASSTSKSKLSSLQTADRLNSLLPIHLDPKVIEANPEFVKLLEALSNHITEDGISKEVQRDLTQAEDFLCHEKHKWLMVTILHKELRELITDYQLQSLDAPLPAENKKCLEVLQQCLTSTEVKDYLNFCPDNTLNITLLGITPDDIQTHNPWKKNLKSVKQKLIPEVEDRLQKKCEQYLQFFDSSSFSEDQESGVADPTQLPSMIEKAQRTLRDGKRRLKKEQRKRDKQFWQYYQTLMDSLMVLEKLVYSFKLKQQSKVDRITAKWLMAKCDALYLKIKLKEQQVLCETYTAQVVDAHRKIKKHLDSVLTKKQTTVSQRVQVLSAYETVGMGFDALVEEYGHLVKEVESKEWALQELSKPHE